MNRYDSQNNYLPAVAKASKTPVVRIEGAHVQRIAESALQARLAVALIKLTEKAKPLSCA